MTGDQTVALVAALAFGWLAGSAAPTECREARPLPDAFPSPGIESSPDSLASRLPLSFPLACDEGFAWSRNDAGAVRFSCLRALSIDDASAARLEPEGNLKRAR